MLELLVWMKTEDARKRNPRNKPKPFTPNFMQGEAVKEVEAMDIDAVKELLAKPRE